MSARGARRALGLVVAALAACAAPQARGLTVVAGPGNPSAMLARHLDATPEAFVVVDVGLWVDTLVSSALVGTWSYLELSRGEVLVQLLTELCERLPPPGGAGDVAAGVAHVARALLTGMDADAVGLPEPWRTELAAVVDGRPAVRAWQPELPATDWRSAIPNGGYVEAEMRRLFRATVYLRASLAAFDADQRAAWHGAVDAIVAGDAFAAGAARLRAIDAGLHALMGTVPGSQMMPGLLADLPATSVGDRFELRAAKGPWWERLAAVHRLDPPGGDSLRSAVLAVAHELAVEAPEDDWLAAWGHAGWRGKWLDLADYAYVAVREVDCLFRPLSRHEPERPRLLIEPLPRTFAALRAAFRAADSVGQVLGDKPWFDDLVRGLDDCLAMLEHQRAGTEPPPDLTERLWQLLLSEFNHDGERRRVAAETRLEGFDGPVRRTGCHLVRVPIRWRGEDTTAIAFHWWVEHRDPDGVWRRAARTAR